MSMKKNTLYAVEGLPLIQNRVHPDRASAEACETGDIRLTQDLKTGLIYNQAFEESRVIYDGNYQNEQANSSFFCRHLHEIAHLLETHMSDASLIEVGCGKGVFLESMAQRGFAITGMDPAYEGENSAIRKEFFDEHSGITGDGIILRHVLEHISDPITFLQRIRDANGGKGLIYIEVPCFDWIVANHTWYDIFYEHVNYFRLSDFDRTFGRLVHAERSFGGQYLSVIGDLSTLQIPQAISEDEIDFPGDFFSGIEACASRITERAKSGVQTFVWGGSSKGVIFSIYMRRAGVQIAGVVDINPAKQNQYLSVSGQRVMKPVEAMQQFPEGSDVIVMNPNYLSEIRELTEARFNYLTI
mgnify:CR=1 FL=1